MTRFYHRSTRLTVWRPRPSPDSPLGAFFEAAIPNAVQVEDHRIQFGISKSSSSTPNSCEMIVTNLAEQTRAEFERLPRKVILEIGFDGELEHLFSGDVTWAASKKIPTGWETTIRCRDGGRAYSEAHLNRSFAAGTATLTVIRAAAKALGLDLPAKAAARADLQRQFAAGYAAFGRASDELSKLLAPFNLGWSIQDGTLQIAEAGEVARVGQVIVIEEPGMIGSPAYAAPSEATGKKAASGTGGNPVLTVEHLLYPQIGVGGVVEVRARNVRGQFKVLKVDHKGDSFGEARTAIECVEPRS